MDQKSSASDALDGGISLSELVKIFLSQWRLVAGSVAFTLACAGIYLALTPSHYKAMVTVTVGRLGMTATDPLGIQIEDTDVALGRLRSSEFQRKVVSALSWTDAKRVSLLNESLQVYKSATGDVLISVHGLTPEDATAAAIMFADELASVHRELMSHLWERKIEELAALDSRLAESEAALVTAVKLLQKGDGLDSGLVPLLRLIDERRKDVEQQRHNIHRLKQIISLKSEKPSTVIRTVSETPKANRVWSFSAFVGVLLGVFLVTVVAIRRMKLDAASSSADR